MKILSIDIGTSRTKVGVYSEKGEVLYKGFRASAKRVETTRDPNEWISDVTELLKEVVEKLGSVDVIGLTGNMHALLPIDELGNPVMEAILWNDTRADPLKLLNVFDEDMLLRTFLNPPVPAFPLVKMIWLKDSSPDVYERARWFLQPKDFVALWLTGKLATDVTDASGTYAFDTRSMDWKRDILEDLGIDPKKFPRILKSTEIVGYVRREVEELTGLKSGTPVVIGAGDLATALIGSGVRPGDVAFVVGTAGQMLTYMDDPKKVLGKLFVFSSPIPEKHLILGTVPAGGYSFDWLSKAIGKDTEKLLDMADRTPDSRGLVFLPYILGGGTPSMKYEECGAFLGFKPKMSSEHMSRAVAEGVIFSLEMSLETLGFSPRRIVLQSLARRKAFAETVKSLHSNSRVLTSDDPDSSLRGAAVLASVGIGEFGGIEESIESMVKLKELEIQPRGVDIRRNFLLFKKLYKFYMEEV